MFACRLVVCRYMYTDLKHFVKKIIYRIVNVYVTITGISFLNKNVRYQNSLHTYLSLVSN